MTITINSTTLSASSGVLTLEESNKNIKLKSNQLIFTDNYITSGTYVFQKGTKIPVAYFAARRTSGNNSTFIFNVSAGTVGSVTNGTAEVELTPYFTQLAAVLADSSVTPSYTMSACVSSVSATGSVGTTEKTYYLNNKSFNRSAYSSSNPAPVVRANDESIPNLSNAYANGQMNGKNIQFGVSSSNNTFISLVVQL